jgi:hypothetical protein
MDSILKAVPPRRGLLWKLPIICFLALIVGLTIVNDESSEPSPSLQEYAAKWNGWWLHLSQPYWGSAANAKPPKDPDAVDGYSSVLGDPTIKDRVPVADPTNKADILKDGLRIPNTSADEHSTEY